MTAVQDKCVEDNSAQRLMITDQVKTFGGGGGQGNTYHKKNYVFYLHFELTFKVTKALLDTFFFIGNDCSLQYLLC